MAERDVGPAPGAQATMRTGHQRIFAVQSKGFRDHAWVSSLIRAGLYSGVKR
jgi:hypothetical protein